jgi:hypothetical protein
MTAARNVQAHTPPTQWPLPTSAHPQCTRRGEYRLCQPWTLELNEQQNCGRIVNRHGEQITGWINVETISYCRDQVEQNAALVAALRDIRKQVNESTAPAWSRLSECDMIARAVLAAAEGQT